MKRRVVIPLAGLALIMVGIIWLGVTADDPGPRSHPTPSTHVGKSPGEQTGDGSNVGSGASGQDRWTEMELSGELHDMLQQHQQMMEQMQNGMSPQMVQLMRDDPMWQMLDSGEAIELMEKHQGDIEQMLAEPDQ
jgi:hypothetical protein